MDSHDLAELLTGLASRFNNLMIATTGETSRQCGDLQDKLAGQAMAAIACDLDHAASAYADAVAALRGASQAADDAEKALAASGKSIEFVAKAIQLASRASVLAASVLA
ncbi:hypothetical protein [Chromobacterium sphagni]|nr:hypothetical protein [Chromobacterium sphagni]